MWSLERWPWNISEKIFERMGSSKKVWMFDTFEGMAEPTEHDVNAKTKKKHQ